MIIINMLIVNVLVINTIRATPVEEGELEIFAFLPKQPALEAKKKKTMREFCTSSLDGQRLLLEVKH